MANPSKPLPEPRCLKPECQLPAKKDENGNRYRYCSDHQPKPLTLREQIAAGSLYLPVPGSCHSCGDPSAASVDKTTGLCRACWRAWRWSPVQERGA